MDWERLMSRPVSPKTVRPPIVGSHRGLWLSGRMRMERAQKIREARLLREAEEQRQQRTWKGRLRSWAGAVKEKARAAVACFCRPRDRRPRDERCHECRRRLFYNLTRWPGCTCPETC